MSPISKKIITAAFIGSFVVAGVALPILWSQPGALMSVGLAEEVHNYVRAEATDGEQRTLRQDEPVFFGDQISTYKNGYVKIKLLDETTFTIGARSTITLDEFVYDPNTDEGVVTASVAKGVFRFVTGKIVKKDPEKMKVHMKVGTIGVRGTQASGEVKPRREFVMLEEEEGKEGEPTSIAVSSKVEGKVVEVVISQPGQSTVVTPDAGPSAPVVAPKKDAERVSQNLLTPDAKAESGVVDTRNQPRSSGGGATFDGTSLDRKKEDPKKSTDDSNQF